MKKTKEKIIEDWKRDLIFDLGNLVSPEAIIIIFGKIDELLSLQTQEMVEEIEKEIKAQEILSDEKEFRFHCKSVIRVLYRLKQTLNK